VTVTALAFTIDNGSGDLSYTNNKYVTNYYYFLVTNKKTKKKIKQLVPMAH